MKSLLVAPRVLHRCLTGRFGHYVQGQSPKPGFREYFYFIDHQGMVVFSKIYTQNSPNLVFIALPWWCKDQKLYFLLQRYWIRLRIVLLSWLFLLQRRHSWSSSLRDWGSMTPGGMRSFHTCPLVVGRETMSDVTTSPLFSLTWKNLTGSLSCLSTTALGSRSISSLRSCSWVRMGESTIQGLAICTESDLSSLSLPLNWVKALNLMSREALLTSRSKTWSTS